MCAKVPLSSARVVWRVPLPCTLDSTRRRSREFTFSADALGEPIKWQIEIELSRGVPVDSSDIVSDRKIVMLDAGGVPKRCRQSGLVRMWTTNQWTTDATRHYYGSHCTVSLRDSSGASEIREEEGVDIDNSQALEFDAGCLPKCREAVIHIHLTLALERAAPLNPFYRLIADTESGESDAVRIGYCKAVFEVARCKRKSGAIFVRPCDRDVAALVRLAGAKDTGGALRVEVLQALFNLLGPTSILLPGDVVTELLLACFRCLHATPVPAPADASQAALLAQNALGAVFNLLVHPLSKTIAVPSNLRSVTRLLAEPLYAMCHFSALTVALTMHARGLLPEGELPTLHADCAAFMAANDPVDSDCTGVAWDESDVAAFFLPLLRSGRPICVDFAAWCMAKYYFPGQMPAAVSFTRAVASAVNTDQTA